MNSPDVHRDRRLGGVLLGAAILQIVAPIVQRLVDVPPPGADSDELMITPAGWAFSIWGLIYFLALAHAVVTVWRHDGVGHRRFTLDLVALYLAATVWIAISATGTSWATFVVLVVMTWFAIDAARMAASAPPRDPGWITHLARAASGLYAGWVSAAVFLNLGTGALELDLVGPGSYGWQIALLAGAAIFAIGINALMPRSPGYAVATIWAQIGVIAAVAGESDVALAVAVVAIVLLVAQTVFLSKRVLTDSPPVGHRRRVRP